MPSAVLIYGNESVLVKTRALILEHAGYEVFSAETFGNAMLVLMNHRIGVCVLCQSLKEEERRGIIETAHALQPETKCLVLDFAENDVLADGVEFVRGLPGPTTLLTTVEQLFSQQASTK